MIPPLPLTAVRSRLLSRLALLLAACGVSSALHAQWVTESYALKPGWNAVWMPLDVSHNASITDLAAGNIEEIWRWNAVEGGHFTDTPAGPPSQTQLEWSVWRRFDQANSTLSLVTGNAAYLVKVSDSVAPFTWQVKGKPLAPRFEWSSTGLNFVGFPFQEPASTSLRSLGRFYGFNSVLKTLPTTLYYNGGDLSDTVPRNPLPITSSALGSTAAVRNRAYWIQAGAYTDYYGPVKVEFGSSNGLDFGDERLSVALRLQNVVDPVRNQTVTITLTPGVSETPPVGQDAIAGAVPLLVRGDLNFSTGQYAYAALTGPITRVLGPGESTEVVVTVNRAQLGNTAGAIFQSLLRVTDSLNQTRIDLPVRAVTTSRAGLWSGAAVVSSVDRIVGQSSTPEAAPSLFPLNLIVHSDASGTLRLLQQAYLGEEAGNPAVSASQAAFTEVAKIDGRTSSAHFPVGLKLIGTGTLGLTGTATFTVVLGSNDPTNPFLHTYHPDHDNLDARFEQILPPGKESPVVTRTLTLTFNSSHPLGFNPAWGSNQLGGTYAETVTGLRSGPINCSGSFILQRASSAPTFLAP